MLRRDFLSSLGNYSLIVLADRTGAAPSVQADPGARERTDRVAPKGLPPGQNGTEAHTTLVELETDVLIAGGGLAGVCAAGSAARNGARVVLVQDRSRLGGNSSSEVKMHVIGANSHDARPGWREGGVNR
jgi:heterodisulfide reductase subunit A-like polyferredoxin